MIELQSHILQLLQLKNLLLDFVYYGIYFVYYGIYFVLWDIFCFMGYIFVLFHLTLPMHTRLSIGDF